MPSSHAAKGGHFFDQLPREPPTLSQHRPPLEAQQRGQPAQAIPAAQPLSRISMSSPQFGGNRPPWPSDAPCPYSQRPSHIATPSLVGGGGQRPPWPSDAPCPYPRRPRRSTAPSRAASPVPTLVQQPGYHTTTYVSHTQPTQGAPIRVCAPIPVGEGIVYHGQPIQAVNGPAGYGVYIVSHHHVDFYPCGQQFFPDLDRATSGPPRLQTPRVPFFGPTPPGAHPAQPRQQSYVPFNWQPPPPACDPVDPKWKQMLAELALLDEDKLGDELERERFWRQQIVPMAKYVKRLPGPIAEKWYERFLKVVDGLGMNTSLL